MAEALRKSNRSSDNALTQEALELEKFFTNSEQARQVFEQLISSPGASKRLLIIHGLGGTGKSTLLKMYRLFCRRQSIPIALVSSEEATSPVELLANWAEDLELQKIKLANFSKTLSQYRAIQNKVESEARKTKQTLEQSSQQAMKKVAKTAIEMAASTIPVVGPLAAAVLGGSTEAFADWLASFLSKPDLDLYLDPVNSLTENLLKDLTPVAQRQRLVLMVDTYEQITTLDEWMRDLARQLPDNVLLVLAGRLIPDWNRSWPGWLARAEVVEQKGMTEDDLRTLVQRYYRYIMTGDPDPKQVEEIVRFARGLPIVATTVVELWVRYGVQDFQTVRSQVVADLVDRLLEGVPTEMKPVFEVAAIVRYFNVDVLKALLENGDSETVYSELRRWPFIRVRREGLSIHQAMREMINEGLRTRTPERFYDLHERTRVYYEHRLNKASVTEREALRLEHLYHAINADEILGLKIFEEWAEGLVRYRLFNQLAALLNDVNTFNLQQENSQLWRDYYNAQLKQIEQRAEDAENLFISIIKNEHAESKLKGYALSNQGVLRRKIRFINQVGGMETLLSIIEQSNTLLPDSDPKRVINILTLGEAYERVKQIDKSLFFFQEALDLYTSKNDKYGMANVHSSLLALYASNGNWREMFKSRSKGLLILPETAKSSGLYANLIGNWGTAWVWAGRYKEAEQNVRDHLELKRKLGDVEIVGCLQDLGVSLAVQGKYEEAESYFQEANKKSFELYKIVNLLNLACWAAMLLKQRNWQRVEELLKPNLQAELQSRALSLVVSLSVLGEFNEVRHNWSQSETYYLSFLDYGWTAYNYFECKILIGLARVKNIKGDDAAVPVQLIRAEELAQQYEYNDCLAALRLLQGQIAWDNTPTQNTSAENPLRYYQEAMIYALRYNRFLLDEVLWGGDVPTPLRPIITNCQARGKEGQQLLMSLRDWWQTGTNNLGTPRPDTISPIPEGIALIEAEHLARQREPGNGTPQTSVLEKLEEALPK